MIEKYLDRRFITLYTIPFILGALSKFSFEPYNFTIINLIILPSIFYLISYINKRSKSFYRKNLTKNLFIFGLAFGFGFYLSGIYWITHSLTFDENFKILIPFALIFIPLFLSLFIGLTILLIGPYIKLDFSSLFIFSAGLAVSDFLRANLLTGFPWNLWAYSLISINEILQILNLIGLFSFNLLVITLFTFPIIILFKINIIKKFSFFVLYIFFIFSLFIYGSYEINNNKKKIQSLNNRSFIKIISPNFDLEYGLNSRQIEERFKKLIRYSNPDKQKETIFIWPEGVFSGYNYNQILIFKDLISEHFSDKHKIIFGTNLTERASGNVYNSMIVIDNNFNIIQNYNKRKLVPFGEFLPFEKILINFGLKKITEGHGSFLRGEDDNNLVIDNLNILPMICYEVIFSNLIQKSDSSTNVIINISEDGWFGESVGPDQHFAKSIFRAIENNTFLLRSANRGVSAIIDNKGNIIKRLNRNEVEILNLKCR